MSKEHKLYSPVEYAPIPATQFSEIHGVPVLGNDIFVDSAIPEFSIGEVSPDWLEGADLKDSPVILRRISPAHKRSLEISLEGNEIAAWGDEYGTIFTSLSIKGNVYTDPRVMIVLPAGHETRFSVYGLQDSKSLLRVIKASEMLREAGISTEAITRFGVPEKIPYKGRLVPQEELKKLLLAEVAVREHRRRIQNKYGAQLPDKNDAAEVAKYLKDLVFITTVRATQVGERLRDLAFANNEQEFIQMMGKAFDYANFKNKKIKKDEKAHFFDINHPQDREDFLIYAVSKRIGEIFAKMHNMGLVHGFPHDGNISIAASLCDLDSVRGEPLGDKKITNKDIIDDLMPIFIGGNNLLTYLYGEGYLRSDYDEDKDEKDEKKEIGEKYETQIKGPDFKPNEEKKDENIKSKPPKKKDKDMSTKQRIVPHYKVAAYSEFFLQEYLKNYTHQNLDIFNPHLATFVEDAVMASSLREESELCPLVRTFVENKVGLAYEYNGDMEKSLESYFLETPVKIRERINAIREQGGKFTKEDVDELVDILFNADALYGEQFLRWQMGHVVGVDMDEVYMPKLKTKSKDKRYRIRNWIICDILCKEYAKLNKAGVFDREKEKLKTALLDLELDDPSVEKPIINYFEEPKKEEEEVEQTEEKAA